MGTLSTHVLDTSRGVPATGVRIVLEDQAGRQLADGVTDVDGRVGRLGPERLDPGTYGLRFDSGAYFASLGAATFYPEILVTFTIAGDRHFHVPLLLSPYGYSTYRGS